MCCLAHLLRERYPLRTIPTSLPLKWCFMRSTCRKDWSKAEAEEEAEEQTGRKVKGGNDHQCCCILKLLLRGAREGSHLLTGEHLEGVSLGEVGAESDLLQLKEVLYLLWKKEEEMMLAESIQNFKRGKLILEMLKVDIFSPFPPLHMQAHICACTHTHTPCQ